MDSSIGLLHRDDIPLDQEQIGSKPDTPFDTKREKLLIGLHMRSKPNRGCRGEAFHRASRPFLSSEKATIRPAGFPGRAL